MSGGTLSAMRIVSRRTVFASRYCPVKLNPLADSAQGDTVEGRGGGGGTGSPCCLYKFYELNSH